MISSRFSSSSAASTSDIKWVMPSFRVSQLQSRELPMAESGCRDMVRPKSLPIGMVPTHQVISRMQQGTDNKVWWIWCNQTSLPQQENLCLNDPWQSVATFCHIIARQSRSGPVNEAKLHIITTLAVKWKTHLFFTGSYGFFTGSLRVKYGF